MDNHETTKDSLIMILTTAIAVYNTLDDSSAIAYAKNVMETLVFPLLMSTCIADAMAYCLTRDIANIRIISMMSTELLVLKDAFVDVDFETSILAMSSVTSGLNLLNGSDVDIGMCIRNLCDEHYQDDCEILDTVHRILVSNGYTHERNIGYTAEWAPNNRYKIYAKTIDGIDFEVKVRDWTNTQPIIDLHKKLDKSLTHEQKALYTFGKLLLEGSDCKKLFKLFVYMEQFYGIDGAFKMPAV
jgi:hypothetical protein